MREVQALFGPLGRTLPGRSRLSSERRYAHQLSTGMEVQPNPVFKDPEQGWLCRSLIRDNLDLVALPGQPDFRNAR